MKPENHHKFLLRICTVFAVQGKRQPGLASDVQRAAAVSASRKHRWACRLNDTWQKIGRHYGAFRFFEPSTGAGPQNKFFFLRLSHTNAYCLLLFEVMAERQPCMLLHPVKLPMQPSSR